MNALVALALLGCQEVSVNDTSRAPEVTFLQPIDGGRFDPTQPVQVCASVDSDGSVDTLDIVLLSDIGGTLATEGFTECAGGNVGIEVVLTAQAQVLSLVVTDARDRSGNATAAISPIGNDAPTCSVLSPSADDTFAAGELIDVIVRVEDADGGDLSVALESSIDGALSILPTVGTSTVNFNGLALSAGGHDVTVTVTDGQGATGVCVSTLDVIGCVDIDGDGFDTCSGDCDDTNADTNPAAAELPDGRDNDCDGVTDEGTALFDDDGDGFTELDGDCDDNDGDRFPGGIDDPDDGVDQDCNGVDAVTCYEDSDGDGYGIPNDSVALDGDCYDPGESPTYDDCDDDAVNVHPGAAEIPADGIDQDCDGTDLVGCYQDLDGDGFGTDVGISSADADCNDAGESAFNTDCNDSASGSFPGATEIYNDGIDQDCNGFDAVECFVDADFDGFGSSIGTIAEDGVCDTADNEASNEDDCDDSTNTVYPGAPEVAGDGIDQDCSGGDAATCFTDSDGDGYGTAVPVPSADGDCTDPGEAPVIGDCDDGNPVIHPGVSDVPDDGVDQDCSGSDAITCFEDLDEDGYGSSETVVAEDGSCTTGQNESPIDGDCDDGAFTAHPNGTEVPDDGIDQDCSGADAISCFRDADQDGYGTDEVIIAMDGVCDTTAAEASVNGDCNDADPAIHPGADDSNGTDGIDSDCNGADGADADGDGFGSAIDCDDNDPAVNPGATETFDGADNNCNGMCDEGFINPGDLVITEVLSDPDATTDTRGEWFEIHNPTGNALVMCGGWTFEDDGADSHTVSEVLTIPAGGYIVAGVSASLADNGGAPVDYAYPRNEFALGNSGFAGDELALVFDGVTIDHTFYTSVPSGRSQQLDAGSLDAVSNDSEANWCDATSAWPGSEGDLGSPGQPNMACP